MKREKVILLIALISLVLASTSSVLVVLNPFRWNIAEVVQQVSSTSRLEKIIPRSNINFASFYGAYVFPYDFFEKDEFRRFRSLTEDQIAMLTGVEKETYDLFRLAESLGITTLSTTQFFYIQVMARCGIDFSKGSAKLVEHGGRQLLLLPPLTITEFQIVDEPLPGWPDFPFSVQNWKNTVQTLKPHLLRLVQIESGLEEIAGENVRRLIDQLARSLGYVQLEIQFQEP